MTDPDEHPGTDPTDPVDDPTPPEGGDDPQGSGPKHPPAPPPRN